MPREETEILASLQNWKAAATANTQNYFVLLLNCLNAVKWFFHSGGPEGPSVSPLFLHWIRKANVLAWFPMKKCF